MGEQKKFRRWNYVVDWKSQIGTAIQIIAVLAGICLVCAVGIKFVKSNGALEEMGPEEIRTFLFKATSVQFLINAITLAILSIYLTHRFAGPAFVMDRAIRESIRGQHDREVRLRDRDYLKPLAASVETLRAKVEEQEKLLIGLAGAVDENDLAGARKLLQLAGGEEQEQNAEERERAFEEAGATEAF